MAFCSNCGTQLSDGAKFCPKCGNPIEGSEFKEKGYDNSPHFSVHEDASTQTGEQGGNKYLKYIAYVFGALCFFYIVGTCEEESSSTESATEQYQESQYEEQKSVENDEASQFAERKEEVKERGYKAGYENGFTVGPSTYVTQDPKRSAKTYYSTYYGAPMSDEEKTLCNIFVENYVKGYEEGHRNQ